MLRVKGARNKPLWLRRALPRDVRVTFDVRSESPEGDIKIELFGDGVSKAETTSYTATSYVVIFGGWNNSLNVLARMNEHGDDRAVGPSYKVVQGKTYHMKIERRGATIRAWVDDHELAHMTDPKPLEGPGHDHFAFNNWQSELWFDNLRIEALRAQRGSWINRQFEATLSDAEIRLRRLRTLYDQWFHGLERTEPQVQRAEIDRMIMDLRRAQPRNTALRFRFNQLVQRYTSYNTYWQRITRQIEEGTYKRDVLRAQQALRRARRGQGQAPRQGRLRARPGHRHRGRARRRDQERAAACAERAAASAAARTEPAAAQFESPAARAARDHAVRAARQPGRRSAGVNGKPPRCRPAVRRHAARAEGDRDTEGARAEHRDHGAKLRRRAEREHAAAVPAVSRKPPPVPPGASRSRRRPASAGRRAEPRAGASSGSGALSDDQIQGIYARYVEARKQNKERVDNVKIETVAKTVRDMLPKLEQKHAGKKIDFEVVVKDGRVALKPVA